MSPLLGPFEVDPSVRRFGPGGTMFIGGSPRRLVTLTGAGTVLFDELAAGRPVRATRGVTALVDRLVAGGLLHPCPPPLDMVVASDVTVVVPVKDHAPQLGRLLSSLTRCSPRPVRVVVVDDSSLDPQAVASVVDEMVAPAVVDVGAALDVELVRLARSGGPAASRNVGAGRVGTPLVAFVDADCVVDPGWLGPLLAQLEDPGVAMAAPRVRVAPSGAPGLLERHDEEGSPLDLGSVPGRVEPGTRVSYVPSAAVVMRIEDLRGFGGFDEELRVGEDVDLVWRLVESGRAVRYDPRSVVRHEVRATLGDWLSQRFAYGTSAAALDERHPGRVAPVVCSPWSALVWGLVAIGRYETAAAIASITTERLRRRLPGVPIGEVVRLGLGGHASAGLQFARATLRVWWPFALVGALVSRRARRWVVGAAALNLLSAQRARSRAPGLLPAVVSAPVRLADDLAYGAGVWWGCARRRRFGVLLPRLGARRPARG